MTTALIAVAIIISAVLAAGTCLVIFEEALSGGVLLFFGMLGYLCLLSMIVVDAQENRKAK